MNQITYNLDNLQALEQSLTTSDQRILLFHDGSMTKLLELINCSKISIEVLSETSPNNQTKYLDANVDKNFQGQRILRETFLKTEDGLRMLYARSIWSADVYNLIMSEKSEAIGKNLITQRKEQFREITGVFKLDREFVRDVCGQEQGEPHQFARCYYIWSGGCIMTYIEEYFFCI